MPTVDTSLDDTLNELGSQGRDVFVLSLGVGGRSTTTNAVHDLNHYDWSGLIAEPAPELFEQLRSRLGDRTNIRLEQVAVAAADGEVQLLTVPPRAFEVGGAPAALSGRASLVPVRAAATSANYRALADRWGRLVPAPALRLDSLLARHEVSRVDILQIDACGYEWSIFRQFDLGRFQPSVVRLAWSHPPVNERIQMVRRLERHGYRVTSLGSELVALKPRPEKAPVATPQAPPTDSDVVLYAITFNWPEQFERWLRSAEVAAPEMLRLPRKFLLDNSTRSDTREAYDQLAARHGWTILRHGNLGISGGRHYCAKHFDQLDEAWGMLWFEDDMLLAAPSAGVCRNGLITHVPALIDRARAIVVKENLDFLKLSFTEFFGDHHLNWAWYNVPEELRRREFPHGTYRTKIEYTGAEDGVSYAVGEVHYSNWPTLMTRRGNAQLFLAKSEPLHEQHYMVDAFTMVRAGQLRAGVLLASPIQHDRVFHYPAAERKEF